MSAFLNVVSSVASIAAPIMTGIGQMQQGQSGGKAEEFNAAVSRANAQAIRQSADLDITRQKRAAKSMKSTQIARYGKAGVKLEGSPLEVLLDSASAAEFDMAITDYNAKVNMAQAEAGATQHEQAAKVYKRKGITEGMNTLLSASTGLQNMLAPKQNYAYVSGKGKIGVAPKNYYLQHSKGL